MASEFSKDNQQTDNPFVDKLLKNLKILAYNSIIKDEKAADEAETEDSLKNAEVYAACIENRVSLALFEYIPDQFLRRAGLDTKMINLYHVYKENVDVIPKDDEDSHYRHKLVSLLRPWYISNYEEKNEYYRLITGKPPLNDWGIPVRDYEQYLPDSFTYSGEFVHEIGVDRCKELEDLGVLAMMRNDYPDAKYLDYVTAGLTSYEARKNMDFMILYTPPDVDYNIKEEFLKIYQERRDYLIRNVYSSVMEIQSEHYHEVMQIYLLVMTMVDMLADVQSHMVKKDILDRRCIEYIFSMYGVPYFRSIPYKFQERICMNLHNLIKYKSCTEGLEQIAKIFGLDDVEFFKYYLVKQRKKDIFGEFIWDGKTTYGCKYNDIIEHEILKDNITTTSQQINPPDGLSWYTSKTTKGVGTGVHVLKYNVDGLNPIDDTGIDDVIQHELYYDSTTDVLPPDPERPYVERYINYPFQYYLQKGNKIVVYNDDKVLIEGKDYLIHSYNVIRIYRDALHSNNIAYHFYYDITSIDRDFDVDTEHSLELSVFTSTKHKTNKIKIDPLPFPYDYYQQNQSIIVSVGSTFLSPIMYKLEADTVTIDPIIDIKGRTVSIILLYSRNMAITFEKHYVTASKNNQTQFHIPEPFPFYVLNENSFFVNIGTSWVDPERYSIDPGDGINNASITFTDGTVIKSGKTITFNFIYSKNSIVNKFELKTEERILVAENPYQTTFKFDFPVENYIASRYRLFVNIFGAWLPPSSYTFTNDEIVILDESLALRKGDKIKVFLAYVDKDVAKSYNIKVEEDYRLADEDRQSDFTIKAPLKNYVEKDGKLIVDVHGQYLPPEDYEVDFELGTFVITNYKRYLYKNQRLNYTFVYNGDIDYQASAAIQQVPDKNITATTPINLNFPFFPYLETNQKFIVLYGSTIIAEERIHMVDSFSFTIEGFKADPNVPRNITILFIYSNWYSKYIKNQSLIVETKKVPIPTAQTWIDIPEPMNKYIINDWPMIITYGEENKEMPESKYDIIETEFNTYPVNDLKNGVYGDYITFTFIYLLYYPWSWSTITENYDKTTKLIFCKIPVSDMYSSKYLLDEDRYKDFDMTVAKDGWWTGKNYKDDNYELIKQQIYEMPFNYSRSKYYGLGRVIEFASHTAKMAFFYSELFDDVFVEKNLNITIKSLSETHTFNIAHLILYMTCLTYIYNGQDDVYIETPIDGKYVTGYNMKTSMEKVRRIILKNHFDPDDFPIWDFVIPTRQIEDLNEFVRIHKKNEEVYHIVRNHMVNAEDYREYKAWKDVYDELFTWQYNTNYYKLASGKVAETFGEFLAEKDLVLYNSIQRIKEINDEEEKIDTITNTIDDICYIIEDFITKDLSRYVFSDFVGHSTSSILNYMMNIINFFKSHKIVFSERGEVINVGGSGVRRMNEDSVFKIYDMMSVLERFGIKEGLDIVEDLKIKEIDIVEENKDYNEQGNHIIREDCQITKYVNGKKEETINVS